MLQIQDCESDKVLQEATSVVGCDFLICKAYRVNKLDDDLVGTTLPSDFFICGKRSRFLYHPCDCILSLLLYFVKHFYHIFLTFYHTSDIIIMKGGIHLGTINERVSALRKKLGMNQKDFAETLAIKQAALSMIESGQRDLSEKNIKLICAAHKVNYDWLVNGTGEMFQDDDSDAQAIVDSVMTGDNEFAKKILVQFARLDESRWRQIEEILNELKKE
jgi:transcriptional regulator with XRE-family HTH domain